VIDLLQKRKCYVSRWRRLGWPINSMSSNQGICDYSDSHRNKGWQGYAAMAAAAYTKNLLHRISPNQVEAEKRVVDIVTG
jgi:hypothetical protein